jgi:hypothetical protein
MFYLRASRILHEIGIASSRIARRQPGMEGISLQNSLKTKFLI